MSLRKRPTAQCTRCGKTYSYVHAADARCIGGRGAQKCRGVVRAMLAESDWQQCSKCQGTGQQATFQCNYCFGSGWVAKRA